MQVYHAGRKQPHTNHRRTRPPPEIHLLAADRHDLEDWVVPHLVLPAAAVENLVLAREKVVRRVLTADLPRTAQRGRRDEGPLGERI